MAVVLAEGALVRIGLRMFFFFCILSEPLPYHNPLLFAQGKFTQAESPYEKSQSWVWSIHVWLHRSTTGRGYPALFLRYSHFNLTLKHDFMTLPTFIQGKYAEAEPLYVRATEILEKALGPEHPNVATPLNNRAWLLRAQVRAVRIFQECG